MKKERDAMYYGMGYSMFPYQMQSFDQNIINNQELENRLSRLERQVRRIDIRLSRLEAPNTSNYQSSSNSDYPFKPDNSMYMM